MKTAIITPGMPSKEGYYDPSQQAQSNKHWLPWLQRELLLKDILAQAIEWPKPYAPVYEDWLKTFEGFQVDEDTDLIGHSCGGGFLLRWLSENDVQVGKVVLVAPWLDPEGEVESDFFDFELDLDLTKKADSVHVFISKDDEQDILDSVATLRAVYSDIQFHELEGLGHFTFRDMRTVEFPELRDLLLS